MTLAASFDHMYQVKKKKKAGVFYILCRRRKKNVFYPDLPAFPLSTEQNFHFDMNRLSVLCSRYIKTPGSIKVSFFRYPFRFDIAVHVNYG